MQGKRVAISGSGNVAIYAAYKCLELGAKVITLSDSGGYHIVEEGMTKEMVDAIDDIKVAKKGRLHEYKNDKGEPYRLYPHPLLPLGACEEPLQPCIWLACFLLQFGFMLLHHKLRLMACVVF